MNMVELLWVPLSLIVGGASVLTLTFASLRPRQSSTQEPVAWYEDRAA